MSKHCAYLVQLTTEEKFPPKPFNFWVKHGEFINVVEES